MKPMEFERVYKLKAMTPLIHFQPREPDATLRATEVKPKLDKFLYECAKKDNKTELLKKNKVKKDNDENKDYVTLNYKMRIEAAERSNDNSPEGIENYKFYFGNIGGDTKEAVFKNATITIISFDTELLDYIGSKISDFFIITNFGTRQSKGFGSFLVEKPTGMVPNDMEINDTIKKYFKDFFYARATGANALQKHNHALTVYTVLKNGLNLTRYDTVERRYRARGKYIKGFALRNFLPTDVGSDKAFMKSKIVPVSNPRGEEPTQIYTNYTFIRALLGLADHYEFRDDMRNNGERIRNGRTNYIKYDVNYVNYDGTTIEDAKPIVPIDSIKNDEGIKRFKSPLLIKIFQGRIYFIFDESYKEMLNQIFIFMDMGQYRDYKHCLEAKNYEAVARALKNCKWIKTPSEFNASSFIKKFIEYYSSENIQSRITDVGAPYKDSAKLMLTQERGNGTE